MLRVNQQTSTTGISSMPPSILRHIWSVIEETHASFLLKLSDTELLEHLIGRLTDRKQLNVEELCDIKPYIYARIPLIRDDAQARLL